MRKLSEDMAMTRRRLYNLSVIIRETLHFVAMEK